MAVFNLPIMILSDRTAPVITGTTVGTTIAIDENIAASSLVATMTHDGTAASFAIASGNTNGDFAIANNGDITVANSPDYETTSSYSLGITATDAVGNTSAPFTVTININDLDEIPPAITLVSQPYTAVFETDNNLTIASFTATDNGNDVTSSLTLSGTPNATNFALSYNSSTQQMDLVTASSGLLGGGVTADQTFTLTASATDASGNTGSQSITLVVKNAEVPTITSGSASFSIIENTSTSTVLQTYGASGTAPISWSVSGTDANDFNINANGELTFATSPDYESQTTHYVTVVATNQFGSDTLAVTVTITNDTADDYQLTYDNTVYDFSNIGATLTIDGPASGGAEFDNLSVNTTMNVQVRVWGAGGGAGQGGRGAAGGRAQANFTLQAGSTYTPIAGVGGRNGKNGNTAYGGGGGGGSGGGDAKGVLVSPPWYGRGNVNQSSSNNQGGGGGGGMSGFFSTSTFSASTALLIAGGGGGGGYQGDGGSGGSSGYRGDSHGSATGGGGASSSSAGHSYGSASGQGYGGGGEGGSHGTGGGGGGGGWYGGGGGDAISGYGGGGGGGSSYAHSTLASSASLSANVGASTTPTTGAGHGNSAGYGSATGNGSPGRVQIVRIA